MYYFPNLKNIPIYDWPNLIVCYIYRAVSCKVFIGTNDLYEVTSNDTFASQVFYEHPYYDPKEIKNDVALVELPREIEFSGKN